MAEGPGRPTGAQTLPATGTPSSRLTYMDLTLLFKSFTRAPSFNPHNNLMKQGLPVVQMRKLRHREG